MKNKKTYIIRASSSSTDYAYLEETDFREACKLARERIRDGATKVDIVTFEKYPTVKNLHYKIKHAGKYIVLQSPSVIGIDYSPFD